MCGRFSLTTPAETIVDVFGIESLPDYLPRYNIAPTTQIWGIRQEQGQKTAARFRWGLVPFWAKDLTIGYKLLNARSETVHQKPSFKAAFQQRRLLILTDGFYEWIREGKQKTPFYFQTQDRRPFAIGGLWERWFDPEGGEVQSATLLTTSANETMTPYHHRMPVILSPDRWEAWLDPQRPGTQLDSAFLAPCDNEILTATQVTPFVNNVRNQGPECVVPA